MILFWHGAMRFTSSFLLLALVAGSAGGCDRAADTDISDDAVTTRDSESRFERKSRAPAVPADAPRDHTDRDWRAKEFGIGVVGYPRAESRGIRGVVYGQPSISADLIATFGDRELCYTDRRDCLFLFDRTIEYTYEIGSWAILGFDSDSSWARVSLDPFGVDSVSQGWVPMSSAGNRPILWSELLPTKWLFFLWPDSAQFYDDPSPDSPRAIELTPRSGPRKYDYSLIPLRVEGRWMEVEVASPSPTVCRSGEPPEVRRDTAWIPYLSLEGRPRTFFFTRGC